MYQIKYLDNLNTFSEIELFFSYKTRLIGANLELLLFIIHMNYLKMN